MRPLVYPRRRTTNQPYLAFMESKTIRFIRRGEVAENGEIVVALVDEAEVTLKRLRRRGNTIALEPANARHEIRLLPADRVKVQGKLVGLLRKY